MNKFQKLYIYILSGNAVDKKHIDSDNLQILFTR